MESVSASTVSQMPGRWSQVEERRIAATVNTPDRLSSTIEAAEIVIPVLSLRKIAAALTSTTAKTGHQKGVDNRLQMDGNASTAWAASRITNGTKHLKKDHILLFRGGGVDLSSAAVEPKSRPQGEESHTFQRLSNG